MNKTIYLLWFQGIDKAPEVVKRCIQSWKHYNEKDDWNIVILDNSNLTEYVQLDKYIDMKNKNINPTALSDVVRLILLTTYGGVWADATTFCNKPLSNWLPNYSQTGFFAFEKPAAGRLLSTWFLYSEKGHYITNAWLQATINYYKARNSPHTYFWVHQLFGTLYQTDKRFKELWDKTPKLPANGLGPHYLQQKGYFNNMTPDIKTTIDTKQIPLYKLTYKCTFQPYNERKLIYYLYTTINLQHIAPIE